MVIKVNDKEYTIKYGIEATAKCNLIGLVNELEETTFEPSSIGKMSLTIAEVLLIGLQNKHKDEFGYDLDTLEGKNEALSKACELLDEYSDIDGNDILQLYGLLNEEMAKNGFIKSLLENQKKQAEMEKVTKKTTKKA